MRDVARGLCGVPGESDLAILGRSLQVAGVRHQRVADERDSRALVPIAIPSRDLDVVGGRELQVFDGDRVVGRRHGEGFPSLVHGDLVVGQIRVGIGRMEPSENQTRVEGSCLDIGCIRRGDHILRDDRNGGDIQVRILLRVGGHDCEVVGLIPQ